MRNLAGLSTRQRMLIGGGAVGLLVVLVAVLLLLFASGSDAADEQPIAFSHYTHVSQKGIQCQYCHNGVADSPVAGIPSVEKCMGCHLHIATDSDEIVELAGYWERGEPVPWVRVNDQPDYVYFNHMSHISAGVSCGSCHGDVANMTTVEPVTNMNMGFCLDCHADQPNKDELWDCITCHR